MKTTQVIAKIRKLNKPAIIAISGFGGSGKSTFANLLASEIHAPVISVDSFFKSVGQVYYSRWEIIDFARMEKEIFQPFVSGNTVLSYGEFDWEKNKVIEIKTIQVNDIVIIEGVGLFRPELMKYFSYTIWLECRLEIAIERGKKRDRNEYGIPENDDWDGIWRENDLQCYREFVPMEIADYILNTSNQ